MKFIGIKNSNKTPHRFHFGTLKSCLAAVLILSANGWVNAAPLTSWDKTIKNVDKRFKLLPELGGVLDLETQLVWEQAPDQTLIKWEAAVRHCYQLKLGDRYGWRLPTVTELTTLLDVSNVPTYPSGHPFDAPLEMWTSTQTGLSPDQAWYVSTGDGITSYGLKKDTFNSAWCVRGKQSGHN